MNIYTIKPATIENGLGVRVSVFVSGCTHRCPKCFSEPTWDFNAGSLFTDKTIEDVLLYVGKEYIDGLTVLGGDPLHSKNEPDVFKLVKKVKEVYPLKNIWLYTGYLYEDIKESPVLDYVDVLVDGEFQYENRSFTTPFRGSTNQRLIDIPATRREGTVVLYSI